MRTETKCSRVYYASRLPLKVRNRVPKAWPSCRFLLTPIAEEVEVFCDMKFLSLVKLAEKINQLSSLIKCLSNP